MTDFPERLIEQTILAAQATGCDQTKAAEEAARAYAAARAAYFDATNPKIGPLQVA